MRIGKLLTICTVLSLLFTAFLYPDPLPGSVVTAQWLAAHLGDGDIRIVDVSFAKKDYDAAHIPNAVFVDWRTDLADPQGKHYFIVPRSGFELLMNRIGVGRDTKLVFYDNFQNRLAIRALWVADYYGHGNTAILGGGIDAWQAMDYRVTDSVPLFQSTGYTVEAANSHLNVDKEYVRRNLSNPDVQFVDGRPVGMYSGLIAGKAIHTGETIDRRGHLPGAVNQPWKILIDSDALFLDRQSLEAKFLERGIDRDREAVVFYCNEGVHAAFDWFVAAKILDFANAKVYDGSMSEWAEDVNLPLEKGAKN